MTWKDLTKNAPWGPGIYFVWAVDKVLYIGSTRKSLRKSLRSHPLRDIFAKHGADKMTFMPALRSDLDHMGDTENHYIQKFKPILDRRNLRGVATTTRNSISILEEELKTSGLTVSAFARSLGLTPQYVCDLRAGRRKVTDDVADRLGYEWTLIKKSPPEGGVPKTFGN